MFNKRISIEQVEESQQFAPKFDSDGLIPVVVCDYKSKDILMHGYMNQEAFEKTIQTKQAHYWSRSRKVLWHKGATSGFYQNVKQMLIDDDQDCVCIYVETKGDANCHVGYRSCFYRQVDLNLETPKLIFTENEKTFDPEKIYPGIENPTQL